MPVKPPAIVKAVLVVNGRGDMRIVKKPRLAWDEVGFPVKVLIPPTWGQMYEDQTISVTLPDAPMRAEVGAPEVGSPQ